MTRLAQAARAVGVIGADPATPVAPHVAGMIADLGALSDSDLRELGRQLSPGQLSGMSVLPDPLPLPADVARSSAEAQNRLLEAARRLLLIAALSTDDRVDVLMAAAAVDASVVLDTEVSSRLRFDDGRFVFVSPRARAEIVAAASVPSIAEAHRCIARVFGRLSMRGHELWHATKGSRGKQSAPRGELLLLAERLLRGGSVHGAYRVGVTAAAAADPLIRARANLVAGRAALAAGSFSDAVDALHTASREPRLREQAENALSAARAYLAGPEPMGSPVQRVAAQGRALHGIALTSQDRSAISLIDEINTHWDSDSSQVDTLHARLFLSASRTIEPWPWVPGRSALSPLVEGHVRGQHLGFHLIMNDLREAGLIFEDAVLRLPMTHIGGGVMRSGLDILSSHFPDLHTAFADSFRRIHPDRVVTYAPRPMPMTATPAVSRQYRRDTSGDGRREFYDLLSSREKQVAELAARGRTNSEVGTGLGISERTVEVHMTSIFRKTGVKTRVELAVLLIGRPGHDAVPEPTE